VTSVEDLPEFSATPEQFMADAERMILDDARRCPMSKDLFGVNVYRRDDVLTGLRDRRAEARLIWGLMVQGITEGQLFDTLSTSILNINGPDHLRQRSLVQKAFTPASIERIRPAMVDLANELIDAFDDDGCANQDPVQVICTMLGVPRQDRHTFRTWLDTISFALSSVAGAKRAEIEAAQMALGAYAEGLIESRRRTPGDDLVTALIAAEDAGDRFSHDEILRMIIGLLFAGHDTTRNQLGRALVTFSTHPDQWDWLADHPEAAPQALDECMRFAPSVGGVAPRQLTGDLTIGGIEFPAGSILSLSTLAASRDPAYVDAPDVFDITASRSVPPLAFGGGPHLCLGINLAKAEMVEALILLSRRLRGLRPAAPAVFPPQVGIYGPTTAPLAFRKVA
jgi:cytochrome P450